MKRLNRFFLIFLSFSLLLLGCGSRETPETTAAVSIPETQAESREETQASAAQAAMVLVKATYMDGSGTEIRHTEYTYDANGFCTVQREVSGDTAWEQRNTPGDNGLIALAEVYVDGTMTGHTLYTYDSQDALIKEEVYEGLELLQTAEYAYDSQGNPSQILLTMEWQTLDWTFLRSYDESGNVLTLEERLDGELVSRWEMTYDDSGRCTLTVSYAADGTVDGRTESIWEDMTETRFCYNTDDVAYLTSVITYDEYGNVTFQEDTYTGGSVSMTEYTYATIAILQ